MGSVGWREILLIILLVLLLFGAKRLPEIARSIGKAMMEFKKGVKEAKKTLDEEDKGESKKD